MFFQLVQMTQSQYTNYAAFNTFTVQGRVTHVEIKTGKYGDFVTVNLVSTLKKDADSIEVIFNDSAMLLQAAEKGYLTKGRNVTLTGRLAGVSETFQDSDGQYQFRKRPQVKMEQVSIMTGGYGAKPAEEAQNGRRTLVRPADANRQAAKNQEQPMVDDTPDMSNESVLDTPYGESADALAAAAGDF